jgi:hypothetical protein
MIKPNPAYGSSVEIYHTYAPEKLTRLSSELVDRHAEMPPVEPLTDQQINIGLLAIAACKQLEDPLVVSLVDDVTSAYENRTRTDQGLLRKNKTAVTSLSLYSGVERFRAFGLSNKNYEVFLESDYVEPASQLIDQIQTADLPEGYRLSKDKRTLVIGSGKDKLRVRMQGFSGIDDQDHPSCQMLDAAWALDRVEAIGPTAITILPETFVDQQIKTAMLSRIIPRFHGHDFRIVSILTDEAGKYKSEFDWPLAA